MSPDDQTAIVTGGASGIGAATCRILAERGADVVVADLSAEEGGEVAASLADAGGGDAPFLASDDAAFVTGATIPVDGGDTAQ